ncbi:MAG: hypothetical protein GXP58_05550 [Deltaproteobacteria bacterium]|nr:hypothetical protein [Deltaproteobacteria bacterium]
MPLFILFICLPPIKAYARSAPAVRGGLRTEHFHITFAERDRRLAESLAKISETVYKDVVDDVGIPPRPGIEVYLAGSHEDFLHRQPQGDKAPEWAAGLAYPERNLMILKVPRAALFGTIDPFQTFRHELAHLTLHQAMSGGIIPRWLDEGLAMYEAREWSFRTTAVISALTLKKKFIPLATLNHAFPVDFNEAEAAYAESFSMVSWLMNRFGRKDFQAFLGNLRDRKTLSQSAQAAFGMTFYELERRWHRWLRFRYTWIPVITSTAALWFIMTLIFLYVYYRKKRHAREKVVEWEMEDLWETEEGYPPRRSKFLPDFPDDEDD